MRDNASIRERADVTVELYSFNSGIVILDVTKWTQLMAKDPRRTILAASSGTLDSTKIHGVPVPC